MNKNLILIDIIHAYKFIIVYISKSSTTFGVHLINLP